MPAAKPDRPPPDVYDALLDGADAVNAVEWDVRMAAHVTGRDEAEARRLFEAELKSPGSTVAAEVKRRGIEPFVWSDALLRFYGDSDAFLFELLGWNRQRYKRSMRQWSQRFLKKEAERLGRQLTVLCHGDGLGLDAAAFARDGHRVTYFEFPGYSEQFARHWFDMLGHNVEVVTDEKELAGRKFDAVTSFDVLEHVPSPREQVATFANLTADPGGVLLVHAPFFLIHKAYPTHLKSNRRYSGSTRLYERAGYRLLDGNTAWNPLAFRLNGDAGRAGAVKRALLATVGQGLKAGRVTAAPFVPLQALLRRV